MLPITPDKIKDSVTPDLYKLFISLYGSALWQSQMENAVYDAQTADITANGYVFKSSGSKNKICRFYLVYTESTDGKEKDEGKVPELEKGENVSLLKLSGGAKIHRTSGTLHRGDPDKTMEEDGIGRPSTYAPIISTILARGYVAKKARRCTPRSLAYWLTT